MSQAEEWLADLLDRYDRNGDGAITTNDFPRLSRGAHQAHLRELDTDGDGVISSEELTAAAEALANDLQERLFNRYDANDDGIISAEESLAVHQAMVV